MVVPVMLKSGILKVKSRKKQTKILSVSSSCGEDHLWMILGLIPQLLVCL